jgi:hypothetical protein
MEKLHNVFNEVSGDGDDKETQHTGLPDFKSPYEEQTACSEKKFSPFLLRY